MTNNFNQETRIHKISTKSLNILAIVLILSGLFIKTQAKIMEEAVCKPRPVTIAVAKNHEYIPYHVVMHRCSGTCEHTSPSLKPCVSDETLEIYLDVTDKDNKQTKVMVTNHTSCHCGCKKCNDNEVSVENSCKCKCIGNHCPVTGDILNPQSSGRSSDDKPIPTPYLIGMAVLGIFALVVFLFDATLLVKKEGFINSVITKFTCCKKGGKGSSNNPETLKLNGHKKDTVV